ncbi:protein CyaE [Geomonas silvestris]|uniref:Protein CyaE n=1 Tax=Geomonas silvestris TaxID=2740184 RepID=A0A6V8MEP0_9BACT|nr:TolC family protein [Geomonas silvestris]GFO58139.1 protein CyaE [Geomonas silvestris]
MKMRTVTIAALMWAALATSAAAEKLTLPECLKSAAANNQALKAASYDSRVAAQNERVAGSGYLPRVDVSGGYTAQLDAQGMSVGGFSAPTQQADYGFFSLGIEQTLYDFGRTSSRLERARAASEATRQGYRSQEQEVFLEVVQAFYGILENEKFLAAAEEEVRQMAGHLKDAGSKYSQGVVTRNDVLQAEVKLANSKQRRLDIARRLENGWLLLNHLTGREGAARATLEDRALTLATPAAQGELAARPDVLAARSNVAATSAEVTEARSGLRPEFYLRAGADYTQNRYLNEPVIMAATVGLRFNLFDGFASSARLRQAVESRSRSEEKLRQTEKEALLEYQTAQNDLKVALERIGTSETAVGQAEENLRLNRSRYEEQMGTSTEVVDAQTLLTQARSDFFQASFDARVAQARVQKALGVL